MKHSRVSPKGQAMGRSAVRLADLGLKRLQSLGLDTVEAPMLRGEMCKTCACRPGVVPNGCLQTQLDFLKAAHEGKPFLCHSPKDGRMCAGWVRVRAELVANPLPAGAVALLDKWEYSQADDDQPSTTDDRPSVRSI
jgi:uncharacterized Zn-binding protein involved in type VI secretion